MPSDFIGTIRAIGAIQPALSGDPHCTSSILGGGGRGSGKGDAAGGGGRRWGGVLGRAGGRGGGGREREDKKEGEGGGRLQLAEPCGKDLASSAGFRVYFSSATTIY